MLVAGTGTLAQDFADRVEARANLGIRVIGHLSVPGDDRCPMSRGPSSAPLTTSRPSSTHASSTRSRSACRLGRRCIPSPSAGSPPTRARPSGSPLDPIETGRQMHQAGGVRGLPGPVDRARPPARARARCQAADRHRGGGRRACRAQPCSSATAVAIWLRRGVADPLPPDPGRPATVGRSRSTSSGRWSPDAEDRLARSPHLNMRTRSASRRWTTRGSRLGPYPSRGRASTSCRSSGTS